MSYNILLSSEILGEIDYEAYLREGTFFYKIPTGIYHFSVVGFLSCGLLGEFLLEDPNGE